MCPAGPQEAQNEPGHPEASEGLEPLREEVTVTTWEEKVLISLA